MAAIDKGDSPQLKAEQFEHTELPKFKKRQELTPAEAEDRDRLADFCLKLARAMLQNSYYSPDHPRARQVADEPYLVLQQLGKQHEEFNFVVASWLETESMALEGIFSEAIQLEQLLGGTAGEHFSKKLADFAKRNKLVSFSIKNQIGDSEFHRFISVFVQRHVDMESQRLLDSVEEAKGPRFTEQLLEKNVVNVGEVLEGDLVDERRRLPWRVKIALARLKKDLQVIPLYAKASAMELRDAKIRILRDILRPLQRGQYLKQLFLNLDLIQKEVAELKGVDMESDLMTALSTQRQVMLAEAMLAEHIRITRKTLADAGEMRPDLAEAVLHLMTRLGTQLAAEAGDPTVAKLLRDLFDEKAVPVSVLPRYMQHQVKIDRWTASYLSGPEAFERAFESLDRPELYLSQLPNLVAIIPNLVRVRRYIEAERVIQLLERHQAEPGRCPGRQELVKKALSHLDDGAVFRLLANALLTEGEEARSTLRKMYAVFGTRSVPPLVELLASDAPPMVRNEAAVTLAHLSDVAPAVEFQLAQRSCPAAAVPFLLRVLAQLEYQPATDLAVDFLKHPRAEIRDAAVAALARMHGRDAQGVLARVLRDPEPKLVLGAIRLFERLGNRSPIYLLRLLELSGVIPKEPNDSGAAGIEIQIAAVNTLAALGNARLGALGTLEDAFIDRLGLEGSRFTALMERGKKTEDDRVRLAVVDALVKLGTEKALARLSQSAIEPNPDVRERMKDAAKQLAARLGAPA